MAVRAFLMVSFEAETRDAAFKIIEAMPESKVPTEALYHVDIIDDITRENVEYAGRLAGLAFRRTLFRKAPSDAG